MVVSVSLSPAISSCFLSFYCLLCFLPLCTSQNEKIMRFIHTSQQKQLPVPFFLSYSKNLLLSHVDSLESSLFSVFVLRRATPTLQKAKKDSKFSFRMQSRSKKVNPATDNTKCLSCQSQTLHGAFPGFPLE